MLNALGFCACSQNLTNRFQALLSNSTSGATNRRLVALLERTAEFKRLIHDTAELKGVHYVALSEVLVDKDAVSEKYAPQRDREVKP